ncbi:hypothetical protein CHUAL_001822 [Chamberlinius hualienensis]
MQQQLLWQLLLLIATCFCEILSAPEEPVVQIVNGKVRGTIKKSFRKRDFYAYQGIPFAMPPVGDLRFAPPVAPANWNGVYNATYDKSVCPQLNNGEIIGNEDCLFVYTYTPVPPSQSKTTRYPVMAFFHISGFAYNAPTYAIWKPERFMDHNVVLVFVGFRQGPLGFLSTNDSAARGNFGLLDQNFALKWIQANIAGFGGDPAKVTIFGSSAGGGAVTFHQLSPLSRGLFRGAIAQSGSSLCTWAIQKDPLKWAKLLAADLKCPTDNGNEAMVKCLKTVPAKAMIQAAVDLQYENYLILPFVPVVEDPNGGRFLTQLPITHYETGDFAKVPTIMGANRDECYGLYTLNQDQFIPLDNDFFNNRLHTLIRNITKFTHNINRAANAVKFEYYTPNAGTNTSKTIQSSIDFMSDSFFKSGFDLAVRKLASFNVPIYYYVFNYAGSASKDHLLADRYQITHGDELYYQFYNFSSGGWTPDDQLISDIMLNYWVNFATYQVPSIFPFPSIWPPTKVDEELTHLEFYNTGVRVQKGYMTQRLKFWEDYVPNIVAF